MAGDHPRRRPAVLRRPLGTLAESDRVRTTRVGSNALDGALEDVEIDFPEDLELSGDDPAELLEQVPDRAGRTVRCPMPHGNSEPSPKQPNENRGRFSGDGRLCCRPCRSGHGVRAGLRHPQEAGRGQDPRVARLRVIRDRDCRLTHLSHASRQQHFTSLARARHRPPRRRHVQDQRCLVRPLAGVPLACDHSGQRSSRTPVRTTQLPRGRQGPGFTVRDVRLLWNRMAPGVTDTGAQGPRRRAAAICGQEPHARPKPARETPTTGFRR